MNREPKKKIRPLWIVLALLLGIPVMLCAGVGLWWVGRTSIAQEKLDQKKKELRARGLPVDNATLTDYYDSLTDDLYTESWLTVIKTVESMPFQRRAKTFPIFNGEDVPAPNQPWPEQLAVEKLLIDYQPTLDELHRITDSDQPVRLSRQLGFYESSFEHVGAMREAVRLLALEHRFALRTGNGALEYEAIDSMLGTAITLRGEPTFVSQLISIALHGNAISAIQKSVERGFINDPMLARIEQRLRQFDDTQAVLRITVAGERAMGLPVFEDSRIFDDPYLFEDRSTRFFSYAGALGARPADALFYLEIMAEMERMNASNLDEFSAENEAFQRRLSEMFGAGGWLKTIDTIISQLISPSIEAIGGGWIRQAVANRLAKTGIAIRRYKLQYGEFPATLADLEQLGFDLNEAKVLSGELLGYRIIDGIPTLWGYDSQQSIRLGTASRIGREPPSTDDRFSAQNEFWRWEFK